jgi:hypothetical protein
LGPAFCRIVSLVAGSLIGAPRRSIYEKQIQPAITVIVE